MCRPAAALAEDAEDVEDAEDSEDGGRRYLYPGSTGALTGPPRGVRKQLRAYVPGLASAFTWCGNGLLDEAIPPRRAVEARLEDTVKIGL